MAVEDYGLFNARLILTPMLSGLAAIGGVLIVGLLPAVEPDGNGAGVVLADIFHVTRNQYGIIVAAVFGLTPRLLLDRLRQQTEQYKADLKSSEASETRAGAAIARP